MSRTMLVVKFVLVLLEFSFEHFVIFMCAGVEQSVYNSDVLSCERDMKATNEKSCRVEVSQFGNVCTKANKFGYESGDPCILLKLNRVQIIKY